MKTIYINESQVRLLKEASEPITFFRFLTEVKKFIQGLLDNPIDTKPSGLLQSHGLTNNILRQKLVDKGIIVRKEKIDEPTDETGKMTSRYYVSYKVPKQDFKRKIRRLYQNLFEN